MKEKWIMPEIEERKLTKWHWLVFHKDNLQLGKNTDIGAFVVIDAKYGVVMEEGVMIGSHSSIYSYTASDGKKGKVTLKKGCKVGTHCVVMPGITIGENSLIGAMSLVNKDIPPNEIWFGSPAKFYKKLEG